MGRYHGEGKLVSLGLCNSNIMLFDPLTLNPQQIFKLTDINSEFVGVPICPFITEKSLGLANSRWNINYCISGKIREELEIQNHSSKCLFNRQIGSDGKSRVVAKFIGPHRYTRTFCATENYYVVVFYPVITNYSGDEAILLSST